MKGKDRKIGLTSSGIMTILVVSMVFFSLLAGIVVFVTTYRASMIQNVKTSSDQAAVQVERIVDNYMDDISSSLKLIEGFFLEEDPVRDVNLNHMADIRSDVTAITSYDPETGELTGAWTGHKVFKKDALANLSFNKEEMPELGEIVISRPHVESLLLNEYPWVVSISTRIRQADGTEQIVVLDSRFSQIASYGWRRKPRLLFHHGSGRHDHLPSPAAADLRRSEGGEYTEHDGPLRRKL